MASDSPVGRNFVILFFVLLLKLRVVTGLLKSYQTGRCLSNCGETGFGGVQRPRIILVCWPAIDVKTAWEGL